MTSSNNIVYPMYDGTCGLGAGEKGWENRQTISHKENELHYKY